MLSWHWPYLFLLLPLPIVVRFFMPALETAAGAIRVPFYQRLHDLSEGQSRQISTHLLRVILLWLLWLGLVTAAAGPVWVGEPINIPQERRDLMLAVDISVSMDETDMKVSGGYTDRITAVKYVVGDFIEQRSSDRLGLILFGEQGYLQTPLTYDSQTVNQQLQEARLGFAGNATAIGDAIGLAIKRLRDRPADSRVLILLTDGANTAGTDPIKAAEIASEAEIRIHTVGVGADSKTVTDFFGRNRQVNPGRDLDEKTLNIVALKTGGKYFRARDPRELQEIYAEINKLEPVPEDQTFRPTQSLAHWPILIVLLISALLAMIIRGLE
ncbi:MAG: VWA domain-containing protein [Acidiferrobacterales bacterium]|nr:VWA domain-containing protein [Acidiferrobacterales bacterium]